MANHKSSIKRIRANEKKRIANRYYAKTMRNALKDFRMTEDLTEANAKLPKLIAQNRQISKAFSYSQKQSSES